MAKATSCSSSAKDIHYMIDRMLNSMRSETFTEKDSMVDVGELAKIFQALKFQLRSCTTSEPSIAEETAAASTAGIRITMTCLKSRQQLVLLREDSECTCSEVDEDKGCWEVMATSGSVSSLVEAASGRYPPLKHASAMAVRRLMEHVGALASGKIEPPQPTGTHNRRIDMRHRLSLGAGDERTPMLSENTSRYRSLDTLIDKDDDLPCLPKPGALLKATSNSDYNTDFKSVSDSNIAVPTVTISAQKSSIEASPSKPSNVMNFLKIAQDNISKAIAMFAGENTERDTAKFGGVHMSKSTEVLNSKNPASSRAMPPPKVKTILKVTSIAKPAMRPIGTTTTNPNIIPEKGKLSVPATASANSKPPTSKKYAHVKSTIPKPTPRN